MNILDENILQDQRELLRGWDTPIHQIGFDVGRSGMKDREIVPFLHQQHEVTFFTRDGDFYDRDLCHTRYCLVHLAIDKDEVAAFVRRVLRHPTFDTKAKRMGKVIRASRAGLSLWQRNAQREIRVDW